MLPGFSSRWLVQPLTRCHHFRRVGHRAITDPERTRSELGLEAALRATAGWGGVPQGDVGARYVWVTSAASALLVPRQIQIFRFDFDVSDVVGAARPGHSSNAICVNVAVDRAWQWIILLLLRLRLAARAVGHVLPDRVRARRRRGRRILRLARSGFSRRRTAVLAHFRTALQLVRETLDPGRKKNDGLDTLAIGAAAPRCARTGPRPGETVGFLAGRLPARLTA